MKKYYAIIYLVLSLCSVVANLLPPFRGIEMLKAIPTALLVVVAFHSTRTVYGPWIVIGIAAGSVGDYLLATLSKTLFIPGLIAFLIGHIAYSVAFVRKLVLIRQRVLIAIAAVCYTAAYAAYVLYSNPIIDGQAVAIPVAGYMVVIATMTVLALLHRASTPLFAWGAIIFVASDSHIPINFFFLPHPLTFLIITGYITYYLAQYLIVEGACRETASLD